MSLPVEEELTSLSALTAFETTLTIDIASLAS